METITTILDYLKCSKLIKEMGIQSQQYIYVVNAGRPDNFSY